MVSQADLFPLQRALIGLDEKAQLWLGGCRSPLGPPCFPWEVGQRVGADPTQEKKHPLWASFLSHLPHI